MDGDAREQVVDVLPALEEQGIEQLYPSGFDQAPVEDKDGPDANTNAAAEPGVFADGTQSEWTLDRAFHLQKVAKSLLLNFLELVGVLSVDASQVPAPDAGIFTPELLSRPPPPFLELTSLQVRPENGTYTHTIYQRTPPGERIPPAPGARDADRAHGRAATTDPGRDARNIRDEEPRRGRTSRSRPSGRQRRP